MRARSSAIRQDRAIDPDYLDSVKVTACSARPGAWYGVFGSGQSLRDCHMPIMGDSSSSSGSWATPESLGDGIMYLLVHEALGEMHRLKSRTGHPRWVMYDMFLGGGQGLRDFKHRCGFDPQRVAWYHTLTGEAQC